MGKTIADEVQNDPLNADYDGLLNGVQTESLQDSYKGVKVDISNAVIIEYYSRLGQNASNTGFVLEDHKNGMYEDIRKLMYIISKRLQALNLSTYNYLISVKGDQGFEDWQEEYFNFTNRLSIWS